MNESLLPQAAAAGAVSGAKQSKADLFEWETAENGAPIVGAAPVSVACTVADVYETPGFETSICTIDGTYVDEADLTEAGKIDYTRVKPVLFEFPTYSYLRTGGVIGPCADFARAARS